MGNKLDKDIINSKLKPRGIQMIGEYTNAKTKSEFMCEHGHTWMSVPDNVARGSGCPHCLAVTTEKVNEGLSPRGLRMITEYLGAHEISEFECSNGHRWHARASKVIGGTGCPDCFFNAKKSSKVSVNITLKPRGIKMVSEYINAKTKSEFMCEHGHTWMSVPDNVVRVSGCPECSTSGYNPLGPGYLYVIDFGHFIKYGITNDLNRRLKKHGKIGNYTVVASQLYEDGRVPQQLERDVKRQIGGKFVDKTIMPDGWTETLCVTKIDLLLSLIQKKTNQ